MISLEEISFQQVLLHVPSVAQVALFVALALLAYLGKMLLVWKYWDAKARKVGYKFYPIDGGLPFFGRLPQMKRNMNRLLDYKLEQFRLYFTKEDKVVGVPMPVFNPKPSYMTVDPVVVKHILKDEFNKYVKTEQLLTVFRPMFRDGIFSINHGPHAPDGGANWTFQRKTAAKVFTKNQFTKDFFEVFSSHSVFLGKQIDKQLNEQGEGIVDMQTLMFQYTFLSIGHVGFGLNFQELDTSADFVKNFDRAVYLLTTRFFRPFSEVPWLGYLLYEEERELARAVKYVDNFTYEVIRKKREIIKQNPDHEYHDIISNFLVEDSKISNDLLRDVVFSFILAGRDTTAACLSAALVLLAQNQPEQEELRKELAVVLADKTERILTLKDIQSCKYLHGVVYESLRMFPPVPTDQKEAAEDDVLPDGTKICKGTRIGFDIFLMGRVLYDNPDVFMPTRWNDRQNPSAYEFPTFQAGPRICLGEKLAVYEVSLALAYVMDNYHLSISEDHPIPGIRVGATWCYCDKVNLKVKKLRQNVV